MPIPGRTRYQPLVDHLAAATGREIVLTLAEVEAIIGVPLSVSASCHPGVWRDTKLVQVRTWERMGWGARLDIRNRCIRFMRAEGWAMASGDTTSKAPGRYQSLIDYLAAQSGDEVTLTYHEVMAVIDGPLPESAILHSAWWTTKTKGHVRAWRALGWRAHASAMHLRVVFTRDAGG